MTDIEIARNTKLNPITEIAQNLGVKENELEQYGKYKAKINKEAFEKMCEEPMENDMLLFQTGIYDYTDEPLFYFDLVRQYPNEDEEFYQIHVELSYKPSSENQKCNESIWNEEIDGDFFEYIRNSESYKCASADSYEKINIYLDET